MDLSKIFSISGKPSLQKLVASAKNGVIVESMDNKKRFHANANNKISCLEDITIFTTDEDVTLKQVLLAIGTKNSFQSVNVPDKDALFSEFENYLPNFDKERVYVSDVKKIFSWYNILVNAGEITAELAKLNDSASAEVVEKPKVEEKKEPKKTTKAVKNEVNEKASSKPASAPKAKKTNQKSK